MAKKSYYCKTVIKYLNYNFMKDWIDIYFMNDPEKKSGMWKKKKAEMKQEAYGETPGAVNGIAKDQENGYGQNRRPVTLKSD
jgi:hypothetical protein